MKPMLAGKFDETKVEKKLPLYGQIKYDGIRVFVRDGIAYTRSLKPVRSEQVQSWASYNKDLLEGLDGEIICGEPNAPNCMQRTSSSIMSFNKPDDFTFYAFDKWDEPDVFSQRLIALGELHELNSIPNVKGAVTELLWSIEDVWEFHDRFISQGHEGIILRDPNAYYKYGRGSPVKCECIKMKEGGWIDTEAKILDFFEQLENTNEQTRDNLGYAERSGHKENLIGKGTLGALRLSGFFEDGREFTCRCGSGMDDELRQDIWNNLDKYRDKIVKIKYFNVGIKDKPRFPIFLGFRDPDDMDTEQLEMFQ